MIYNLVKVAEWTDDNLINEADQTTSFLLALIDGLMSIDTNDYHEVLDKTPEHLYMGAEDKIRLLKAIIDEINKRWFKSRMSKEKAAA